MPVNPASRTAAAWLALAATPLLAQGPALLSADRTNGRVVRIDAATGEVVPLVEHGYHPVTRAGALLGGCLATMAYDYATPAVPPRITVVHPVAGEAMDFDVAGGPTWAEALADGGHGSLLLAGGSPPSPPSRSELVYRVGSGGAAMLLGSAGPDLDGMGRGPGGEFFGLDAQGGDGDVEFYRIDAVTLAPTHIGRWRITDLGARPSDLVAADTPEGPRLYALGSHEAGGMPLPGSALIQFGFDASGFLTLLDVWHISDGVLRGLAVERPCRADLNKDCQLDFFDFLAFQNLFAAGDPEADCDASGTLDFFDFLCFQNEFAAGCP